MGGNLVSKFAKMGLIIVAARTLGPESFGIFNYIVYLLGFFFFCSDLGLITIFQREYHNPDYNPRELYNTVGNLKIMLVLSSIVISIGLYWRLEDKFWILFFLILIWKVGENLRIVLLLKEVSNNHYQRYSLIVTAQILITSGVGVVLLTISPTLINYGLAYLIGVVGGLILLIVKYKPELPNLKYFSIPLLRDKIRPLIPPFWGLGLLSLVMDLTDVVAIKWLLGPAAVGYYVVGIKIYDILVKLANSGFAVLYPLLSSLQDQSQKIIEITQHILRFILLLTVPISVGGCLLAKPLIIGFFGHEYEASIDCMQVLILLLPVFLIANNISTALYTLKLEQQSFKISLVVALINVVLNILFILKWGIVGAAIGTLSAKVVQVLLGTGIIYIKNKEWLFSRQGVGGLIIANSGMASLVYYMTQFKINVFLIVGSGAIIYFGVLLLLRNKDINWVLSLIKKKANEFQQAR